MRKYKCIIGGPTTGKTTFLRSKERPVGFRAVDTDELWTGPFLEWWNPPYRLFEKQEGTKIPILGKERTKKDVSKELDIYITEMAITALKLGCCIVTNHRTDRFISKVSEHTNIIFFYRESPKEMVTLSEARAKKKGKAAGSGFKLNVVTKWIKDFLQHGKSLKADAYTLKEGVFISEVMSYSLNDVSFFLDQKKDLNGLTKL